jgi:hypothetical protein
LNAEFAEGTEKIIVHGGSKLRLHSTSPESVPQRKEKDYRSDWFFSAYSAVVLSGPCGQKLLNAEFAKESLQRAPRKS